MHILAGIILGVIIGITGVTYYDVHTIKSTIFEMNTRQKSVVVTQHKGIEDMIRDICKR